MAAILVDDFLKCTLLNGNDKILIQISLKFVPDAPITKTQHWYDVAPNRRKPLSEPMLTRFTDAYMLH